MIAHDNLDLNSQLSFGDYLIKGNSSLVAARFVKGQPRIYAPWQVLSHVYRVR